MYCVNCGNKIEKNDTFCSKCGKNVKLETTNTNEEGKDRALASMIIGIISMLVGIFFIPLPIIGLILGLSYKGKCSEKTTGIVLNVISLILSIIYLIFSIIFGFIFGAVMLDGIFNDHGFDDNEFNDNKFHDSVVNEAYDKNIWNKYENNREENILDYNVDLKGKWREYVDQDSYYTFNENNFYYYEDLSDPEKDYWEGTYTYKVGKEELKNIGINNKYINDLIDKISLDEDFYIIELKPTKIVDDNKEEYIDKDEDELIRLVFIKEHEDGIEGIFVYPEDEEIEYYYKVK